MEGINGVRRIDEQARPSKQVETLSEGSIDALLKVNKLVTELMTEIRATKEPKTPVATQPLPAMQLSSPSKPLPAPRS